MRKNHENSYIGLDIYISRYRRVAYIKRLSSDSGLTEDCKIIIPINLLSSDNYISVLCNNISDSMQKTSFWGKYYKETHINACVYSMVDCVVKLLYDVHNNHIPMEEYPLEETLISCNWFPIRRILQCSYINNGAFADYEYKPSNID